MFSNKVKSILLVLLFLTGGAVAQEMATLSIEVNDGSLVLPKATVLLTNASQKQTMKRLTSNSGLVSFDNLEAGIYSLTVSVRGYQKESRQLELKAGEQKQLVVSLQLPQFSETLVITTANRREELLKNVAEPVAVISEAEIEASGASTAKELLVDHVGSGLQVENGGGLGHVSINGVSQKGVLLLINGRRILGKNGNGEFSLDDLDISNIERVEVVKGAGSALYGSDAIAGVVNFITKTPESYGFAVNNRFSAGGNDDYRASSSVEYKGEATLANLTASYRDYGGYDLIEETKVTEGQGESKYYQVGGDVEHYFTDRLVFRGMFNMNRRNLDEFYREDMMSGAGYFKTQQEITRITASPELEFMLTDTTVINARYNYSDYYRNETRDYGTSLDVLDPWQEWNHEGQLTLRHGWEIGDNLQTLQAGFEYRDENMDRENILQPGSSDTMANRDITVFWAQNEFILSEYLTVTAGFRYDDYSDFGDEFSPKASAIIKLNDENRIRATYGHGFRAPNFGELYLDMGLFFKGNPDLKPESSDNYTVGWSHISKYFSGSVDYFYNDIKDGIVFDLTGFPFNPASYKNLDELTVSGINLDMSVKLPYGFVPSVAYSYTKREDAEGEEIDNYPGHSATFKLAWNAPQYELFASIRGQYNGEVTYDNGNSRPDYQVWYLNVRKDLFRAQQYAVGMFFQVDNLFDETDFFQRDPSGTIIQDDLLLWFPRRTVTVGLTIDLDRF